MTTNPSGPPAPREVRGWVAKHIGDDATSAIFTGLVLVEEVGEVARAVAKRHRGIRGTAEQWTRALREELGDVGITALHMAARLGLADFALGDVADPHARRQPWRLPHLLARLARHAGALADRVANPSDVTGARAREALVELVDVAADVAHGEGWSLPEITAERWATVTARDPRAARAPHGPEGRAA